jgi:hypothetical protein
MNSQSPSPAPALRSRTTVLHSPPYASGGAVVAGKDTWLGSSEHLSDAPGKCDHHSVMCVDCTL